MTSLIIASLLLGTPLEGAYAAHDYDTVLRGLQQRTANHAMSADDAYDLGVTYLAAGDLANAIAHLVTARDLAPRDTEIAAALAAARSQSGSQQHTPPPWPLAASELSVALLFVNLALCVAIVARRKRTVLVALSVGWLALAALLVVRNSAQGDFAVVNVAGAETHVANDETSLPRFSARLGDELPIDATLPGWLKVRGHDGSRAYIEEKLVARTPSH